MALDKVIEELFEKNPNLSEKDAVNQLKTMKDPVTKKRWRAGTIRTKVYLFMKNRSKIVPNDDDAVSIRNPAAEVKNEKQKREDPFKTDEPTRSLKQSEDVDKQIRQLRTDVVDVIKDLKSEMVNIAKNVDGLKQEINTVKNNVVTYAPVVEYDELKLRINLVDRIQDNAADNDFHDESDYLEDVINKHEELNDAIKSYDELKNSAKSSKHGIRVSFEKDKLFIEDIKKGRYSLNIRDLLIGGGIGGAVATLLTYVVCTVLLVAETVV